MKFTGKERDAESGLDYFGARYYGSALGRFTSPDWIAKPQAVPYADLGNPQSLNLYTYVLNNPLAKADLDGHCFWDVCAAETVAVVALAGATTAYLASPSGQQALHAGGQLLQGIANGIHDLITTKEQARDEKGKFLPVKEGDSKPGADRETKGLDAAGADKNTKPIPGSNRIPDGTRDGGYVEVKGGGVVSGTKQIVEMAGAAAAATGKPLTIVVAPGTTATKPVRTNPNIKIEEHPLN